MNGRVYDYNLGRFLSVDPFLQGFGDSQGINPYSYIMNNPLSGTDPTGYAIKEEVKDITVKETGSRLRRKVGSTTTRTSTNDTTGAVENVTTSTIMNNGDFAVSAVNFDNGNQTSAASIGGNLNNGTAQTNIANINSQSETAGDSNDENSIKSADISARWCHMGSCVTGIENDIEVRSLEDIDKGLERLNAYVSAATGLLSLPGILSSLSRHQLSKNLQDVLKDSKFESRVADVNCTDCDDIARLLFKANNNQGKILDIRNPNGFINVKEFNNVEQFVDHRVFTDGKLVIDPRFSNKPVPINQYMNELKKLNSNIKVTDVTP